MNRARLCAHASVVCPVYCPLPGSRHAPICHLPRCAHRTEEHWPQLRLTTPASPVGTQENLQSGADRRRAGVRLTSPNGSSRNSSVPITSWKFCRANRCDRRCSSLHACASATKCRHVRCTSRLLGYATVSAPLGWRQQVPQKRGNIVPDYTAAHPAR